MFPLRCEQSNKLPNGVKGPFSMLDQPATRIAMKPFLLFAFLFSGLTQVAAEPLPHALSAQKEVFRTWFPGMYTNARAAQNLTAQGIDAGSASQGMRLHIVPVDLPAFGEVVYYAEWQSMSDATNISRQRFYVLREEPAREALRLELHIFDPSKAERNAQAAGAYADVSRIADFTPADMFPLPGCDIFFKVEAGQFRGAMDRGECDLPDTDPPLYSWTNMVLAQNSFWYTDGWYVDATDEAHFLMTKGRWVEFEKAALAD